MASGDLKLLKLLEAYEDFDCAREDLVTAAENAMPEVTDPSELGALEAYASWCRTLVAIELPAELAKRAAKEREEAKDDECNIPF